MSYVYGTILGLVGKSEERIRGVRTPSFVQRLGRSLALLTSVLRAYAFIQEPLMVRSRRALTHACVLME